MLSKNISKLSTGDGNHGPLIKLQQAPQKIMQKRHLGHLPLKNTVCKKWKQHRIILILTTYHQMKRVIWNFNFMLNYSCSNKNSFCSKPSFLHFFPTDKENLCYVFKKARPFPVGKNQFKSWKIASVQC